MNHVNVGVIGHQNDRLALALVGLIRRAGHSAEIVPIDKVAEKINGDHSLLIKIDGNVDPDYFAKRLEKLGPEITAAASARDVLEALMAKKLDLESLVANIETQRVPKEPQYSSAGTEYLAGLESAGILKRSRTNKRHH